MKLIEVNSFRKPMTCLKHSKWLDAKISRFDFSFGADDRRFEDQERSFSSGLRKIDEMYGLIR
ncbi:hypothetical protein PGT21_012387 [Puccinia graminis f. sp. tritici]|uniref:Uncharacterized protein n=1 Tax=Puccinia graminis f. sp. tritici TaxID=56615 RepID=A0A5B0NL01_PUCGR|nr:hypothetical protein PGT21_012387 [Puccinia graminis f. sp. tritici]